MIRTVKVAVNKDGRIDTIIPLVRTYDADIMSLVDNMGTSTAIDDKYEVYYVLVKMYEGVVTDIISFDVPQNVASIVTPFAGTPCE